MKRLKFAATWVGSGIVLILAAVGLGLARGITFFGSFEGEEGEGSEGSDSETA
jgi:hypothetical protein